MTMISSIAVQLQPGDIVNFRFPSTEREARHEKPRPCLVVAVGNGTATIAYGTSCDSRANRGIELHVSHPADIAATRLTRPTRFVGARHVTVPCGSGRLRPTRASGSCRIGTLPAALRPRLERLQGLIAEGVSPRTREGLTRMPLIVRLRPRKPL